MKNEGKKKGRGAGFWGSRRGFEGKRGKRGGFGGGEELGGVWTCLEV